MPDLQAAAFSGTANGRLNMLPDWPRGGLGDRAATQKNIFARSFSE
jgi:hypothetical protein